MSQTALLTIVVLSLAALMGMAVGSFLNVVIARTPRLIDASEGAPFPAGVAAVVRGLSWPPSQCGHCGTRLSWRDNIPVAAYLMLRGRCRTCGTAYGARYVLVELLGAAIAVYCAAAFGPTGQAALLAAFGLGVLALVVIDLEEQLLPDVIVAPLFVLGLAYQALYGAGLVDGLLAAALGFGALYLIRLAYRLYAKQEGMGFGDLKFAAMLGAWVGLGAIPAALLIAFAGGALITCALLLTKRITRTTPTPFGPFLAAGAIAVLAVPALPVMLARLYGF